MGKEGHLYNHFVIMPDINDYGKFETFYQPLPEKKVEDPWRQKEPETPQGRSDPFRLTQFGGSEQEQPPTP